MGQKQKAYTFQWKFRSIFDVRDHLISRFRETVPFSQRALMTIRTEDGSAASAETMVHCVSFENIEIVIPGE